MEQQLKKEEAEGIQLKNSNISHVKTDFLHHLGLGNKTHNLPKMFGDVKFIVMGGTKIRMKNFAHFIMKEINYELPAGAELHDMTAGPDRYSMYKVGPVLSVSHGLGMSSFGVLLHELFKLMFHAKCKDPVFIRLGTSGGVGIEPVYQAISIVPAIVLVFTTRGLIILKMTLYSVKYYLWYEQAYFSMMAFQLLWATSMNW